MVNCEVTEEERIAIALVSQLKFLTRATDPTDRDVKTDLSMEEWALKALGDCRMCGRMACAVDLNGLDRDAPNGDRNYDHSAVPMCWPCNHLKGNKLTTSDVFHRLWNWLSRKGALPVESRGGQPVKAFRDVFETDGAVVEVTKYGERDERSEGSTYGKLKDRAKDLVKKGEKRGKRLTNDFDSKEDGLTRELHKELQQQPCVFCGLKWTKKNGVNRKDSTKGYSKSNVEPMCWPDNNMMSNVPQEAFAAHAYYIVEHLYDEFVKDGVDGVDGVSGVGGVSGAMVGKRKRLTTTTTTTPDVVEGPGKARSKGMARTMGPVGPMDLFVTRTVRRTTDATGASDVVDLTNE